MIKVGVVHYLKAQFVPTTVCPTNYDSIRKWNVNRNELSVDYLEGKSRGMSLIWFDKGIDLFCLYWLISRIFRCLAKYSALAARHGQFS